MSDDNLRAAAQALLDEVDPFNDEGPMRCVPAKELNALQQALHPEEPLKINGMTAQDRKDRILGASMQETKVNAHIDELYKAYADVTEQVYDDREGEVAKLEQKLKRLHSTFDAWRATSLEEKSELREKTQKVTDLEGKVAELTRQLREVHARWRKAFDKQTVELDQLRPAVEVLRAVMKLATPLGRSWVFYGAPSFSDERLEAILNPPTPKHSVPETGDGGSDSCASCGRTISPGARAAGCGCPIADQQAVSRELRPPADSTQEESGEGSDSCEHLVHRRGSDRVCDCPECIRRSAKL